MFEFIKEYSEGLNSPKGCCVDSRENVYISDYNNHRLVKLNKDLQYVGQFGVTGIGKGDNSGLNKPQGCCVDSNDNIYITEYMNHRLVKLNKDLEYVGQFGVTGTSKSDNTGLNDPQGCCADSNGNIYIADTMNHRLVKLNKDLQYVSQFGTTNSSGNNSSTLNQPRGCAVDSNGNIYVADRSNHRLVKLNKDLQYVSQFGVTGISKSDNTGLNAPYDCCVDSNDNIYITDSSNHRLVKLNKDLQYVSQFGITGVDKDDNTGLHTPFGCYVDSNGNIYITNISSINRLIIVKEIYEYETQFGVTGISKSDTTGLNYPIGCCVDSRENVYISDYKNNRLVKLDKDFNYLSQYTSLKSPQHCCIDSSNNLYITDRDNNRLVKLNSNLEYIGVYTNLLTPKGCCSDGTNIYITDSGNNRLVKINSNLEYISEYKKDFSSPEGCCVDSNGNIFITDYNNSRVVKLDKDFNFIKQFGVTGTIKNDNTGFHYPSGCCVDSSGYIMVCDILNHRLVRLNNDLEYMTQFGTTAVAGSNNNSLNYPQGCGIDSSGNVYITDSNNHRLVKLKYLDFNLSVSLLKNKNTPQLADISISQVVDTLKIFVNNEQKSLLNNVSSYKYNLDKIWNTIPTGTNNIKVETEKGTKEVSFDKPEYEDYLNSCIIKDIIFDYTIHPSYSTDNSPLPFTYNITIGSKVLYQDEIEHNTSTTRSITIPYKELMDRSYKNPLNRNITINKIDSSGNTSYDIPIHINTNRLFSKYFNGINTYITINDWTKPLSELIIQVVCKKSTEEAFSVLTDNSLILLTGSTLKIGGASFIGNIYEIRVWEKGKEQEYNYNQLTGNEDGLYALYRINEYNSNKVFDSCKYKLHGKYTGELLNQEIIPSNAHELTNMNISFPNDDIVLQKENYTSKYSIDNKKISYNSMGIEATTSEINLPINNLSIIQNLSITRKS